MVGQALRCSGHGAGIVVHPAQHAYPLAPGHGLSGVALQRDQLLKRSAGGRPVLAHLGDQSADDQDVFALRKALQRLVRQQIGIGQSVLADQIGNGLPDFGGAELLGGAGEQGQIRRFGEKCGGGLPHMDHSLGGDLTHNDTTMQGQGASYVPDACAQRFHLNWAAMPQAQVGCVVDQGDARAKSLALQGSGYPADWVSSQYIDTQGVTRNVSIARSRKRGVVGGRAESNIDLGHVSIQAQFVDVRSGGSCTGSSCGGR